MEIVILKDYKTMSREAAEIVANRVKYKPDLVLGLATGSTPLGMYQELIKKHHEDYLDFSKVTTFNLDEYYLIDKDNPQSYFMYMLKNFWQHVNIDLKRVNIPEGKPIEVERACASYEQKIEKIGGIDLQILGIGENGHIGFNEPGASLSAKTHLVRLTQDTIEANSRFFENASAVPKEAITMGIGTIMKAKEIILLASGENKAEAIRKTLTGDISTLMPASMLQAHPNVKVLLDSGAGKLVQGREKL